MKPINLVIASKIIVLILVALVAQRFLPYLGHFSFYTDVGLYKLPDVLKAFANFDGLHYVKIAREGYYAGGYAFFPIYPLAIFTLSLILFGNHILAALLIANTAFFIACYFLYKITRSLKIDSLWFFVFLLTFPTSFFFHMAYTESLFLMFVALTFYHIHKKNFLAAALFAVLAAATRVTGVFLIFPFILLASSRKKLTYLYVLAPILGLGAYMLFQQFMTGDPLSFFHSQSSFGAGRSTNLILLPQVYIRYVKIFVTAHINFTYFIALIEFTLFTLALFTSLWGGYQAWKKQNQFLLSVSLFSVSTLLLPTFTGTLLSTPRFALLALSMFFFLAEIKNTYVKIALAALFMSLQIILFAFFAQGYFVS